MQQIYFAGGCFWGTEHFFKQIRGVTHTETGFANGSDDLPSPTYEQVYTDTTGYAETVRVQYDESVVSLAFLVRMFFAAIDPLSLNSPASEPLDKKYLEEFNAIYDRYMAEINGD